MPDNKRLAREWFDAALSDYQYALVGLKEDRIYPQVAYLSQQVAEKFLKGFLVLHGIEPPRIHDLTRLMDACTKILPELATLRDACEILNGFYIEVRYPPEIPDITREEIQDAHNQATLVKDAVWPHISPRDVHS